MLKIGICDDDQLIQKQIGNLISNYFYNKQYKFDLYFYSTGMGLLNAVIPSISSFIFLDIDLGKENEVEVLKYS